MEFDFTRRILYLVFLLLVLILCIRGLFFIADDGVWKLNEKGATVETVDFLIIDAEHVVKYCGFSSSEFYRIIVQFEDDIYTVSDKTTYYLYKDKVGETVRGKLIRGFFTSVELPTDFNVIESVGNENEKTDN